MSYIPPHKRHLKDPVTPSPVPDSLVTKSKKNIYCKSSNANKDNAIAFARDVIVKWFLISSNGAEDKVPPSLELVPMSSDSAEYKYGELPMVLMNNNVEKGSEEEERTRWRLLAEKVDEDLVFAYHQAKKAMDDHNHACDVELRLVARFGKLLFHNRQAGPMTEYSQKESKKLFSTNVPTSFIQNIKCKAIPSHELFIDVEKETYVVTVSHYTRPHATIKCKCTVKEDGRLWMYEAEMNPLRHLVVDVSCIDKNLDMRLMLAGKRKMKALTEKEISNIQELLDSATVDPNVKGGLRWPFGKKTSYENGYNVFEVCHVKATIYKNRSLELRIRESDRFNERYGTGEIERSVTLVLQEMNTKLQEQNIERACVLEMLRDALETIWDFLRCGADVTL